jgi:hypothetical protein
MIVFDVAVALFSAVSGYALGRLRSSGDREPHGVGDDGPYRSVAKEIGLTGEGGVGTWEFADGPDKEERDQICRGRTPEGVDVYSYCVWRPTRGANRDWPTTWWSLIDGQPLGAKESTRISRAYQAWWARHLLEEKHEPA